MEFKDPLYLLLLLPLAAYIAAFYYLRGGVSSSAPLSSSELIRSRKTLRTKLYPHLYVLRFITASLLVFAAAGPGKGVTRNEVKNYGVDIMIALDVSGSMRETDLTPDRLSVAKDVVRQFALSRKTDRVGMVIFAGDAYLQSPLTDDMGILTDIAGEVEFGSVQIDGTAIGDAIALSSARLRDSNAQSKIILLITDGNSNAGVIDPDTAAHAAADLGIKIYSIGVGSDADPGRRSLLSALIKGGRNAFKFNEDAIRKLSETTGGKFYRADSNETLKTSVADIDRLEKSEFKINRYHEFFGKYFPIIFLAGIIFLLEMLLRTLVFRKIP